MNVLGSEVVQKQIRDSYSGARMPRITEAVFMNIQIPLPPLPVQQDIVSHIATIRAEIKTLRQTKEVLRRTSIITFGKEIFE